LGVGSAEGDALDGSGRRRVGQAHHPERVEEPDQAGEDRDEERDLQRARPIAPANASPNDPAAEFTPAPR
jgi:hypothetical protein